MFARPSYRLLVLVLAGSTTLIFITLLESWLKTYSRNKISIISPPIHEPNVAPKKIRGFWTEVAAIFDEARPQVKKIRVNGQASTANSDAANGDRKPGPSLLSLSQSDLNSMKESHKGLMEKLKNFDNDETKRIFSGIGVVTVAGGQYFAPAMTSIRMLRRSGSKLPVHVFLQSRAEYEVEMCEDHLPNLAAECYVLEDFLSDTTPFSVTHYQLKALAILFSPFETVLYLDSDCMPLRDPTELLTSEPFTSTGLVLWPDYWVATENPVFWEIGGLPSFPSNLPARSSESGEILISKEKHLTSLLVASYYNVFGPTHFYPLLSQGALGEGDKETFLAGAVVAGNPYYCVRTKVGTIGFHDEEGVFNGGAMVQHHSADDYALRQKQQQQQQTPGVNVTLPHSSEPVTVRPFFLHANYPKMNLGHLIDDPRLRTHNGEGRRIWGPKSSTMRLFGMDVERVVWNEMVEPGCSIQRELLDWRGRHRVCDRAREHWNAVLKNKD